MKSEIDESESIFDELEIAERNRYRSEADDRRWRELMEEAFGGRPSAPAQPERVEAGPNAVQWAQLLNLLRGLLLQGPPTVNVSMPDKLEITKMPQREVKTYVQRDEKGRATGTVTKEMDSV